MKISICKIFRRTRNLGAVSLLDGSGVICLHFVYEYVNKTLSRINLRMKCFAGCI